MKQKITTADFITTAREIHGDRYDYSLVEYQRYNTKVIIICPDHGEFQQTPASHKSGSGCPSCNPKTRHSTADFITTAREIHGDRYDYSLVEYQGNKKRVTIICPDHGEFQQTPANHKSGNGCPTCGIAVVAMKNRRDVSEWVDECDSLHESRYDYSLVKYTDDRTPVTIICPDHGEFQQTPHDHRIGSGCPKCAINACKTTEAFILDGKNVHGNCYDYEGVEYVNAHTDVVVSCPDHGKFTITPNRHLRGGGCPKCSNSGKSHDETALLDRIEDMGHRVIRNTRSVIPPLELDGFFPDHNVAVEYCGLYWHSELRGVGKNKHLHKLQECKKRGIRLITVFEDEWLNKPHIVINRISHALGSNPSRVYARNCMVREIDLSTARDFLDKHHIQGYAGCRVRLGLYHTKVLVGVMTFSLPNLAKGQKNNTGGVYEISRFATTGVVGGGGKLLSAFERMYSPTSIFTFSDLRWGDGHSYEMMGFTHEYDSKPNFWYFKTRHKRIHRFSLRKTNKDNPLLSGWENRILQGWNRIWDCGNAKYAKHYNNVDK